jgi:hypothetical protein
LSTQALIGGIRAPEVPRTQVKVKKKAVKGRAKICQRETRDHADQKKMMKVEGSIKFIFASLCKC